MASSKVLFMMRCSSHSPAAFISLCSSSSSSASLSYVALGAPAMSEASQRLLRDLVLTELSVLREGDSRNADGLRARCACLEGKRAVCAEETISAAFAREPSAVFWFCFLELSLFAAIVVRVKNPIAINPIMSRAILHDEFLLNALRLSRCADSWTD